MIEPGTIKSSVDDSSPCSAPREEDRQRDDALRPDGAHEFGLGEELLVADGVGHTIREKPFGRALLESNSVRRAFCSSDVRQADEPGLGRCEVRLIGWLKFAAER